MDKDTNYQAQAIAAQLEERGRVPKTPRTQAEANALAGTPGMNRAQRRAAKRQAKRERAAPMRLLEEGRATSALYVDTLPDGSLS